MLDIQHVEDLVSSSELNVPAEECVYKAIMRYEVTMVLYDAGPGHFGRVWFLLSLDLISESTYAPTLLENITCTK